MEEYKSAMYQNDVIQELERQANVVFYGPGFDLYNISDSINNILSKISFVPDWIIVGHSWLVDSPNDNVDPHPNLELGSCIIPKAMILNKEYTNLNQKLEWIRNNNFSVIFTHHHDVDSYQKSTNTNVVFWPFAFNKKIVKPSKSVDSMKNIDFSFSGILQNQLKSAKQPDTRIKVMRKLFNCFGDIPVSKKNNYKNLNIFWNSLPRTNLQRKVAKLFGTYKYLESEDYFTMQKKSKIYLNTLSPVGLVSPRMAECMACRALVFCEESELYKNIFPKDCFVTFKSDLSDFDEKLFYYINNHDEREKIIKKAFREAINNHNWEKRVSQLLKILRKIKTS
ncbi:MAG: glycosyltransferase [Candidatus Paceibacterota bacterium]